MCGDGAQMSKAKVFEICPRWLKSSFPSYVSRFLKSHYSGPEEVCYVYGVRYQTAYNWYYGLNKPSGDSVMLIELHHPGFCRSVYEQVNKDRAA